MLCVNTYPRAYIDGCKARIDRQLKAYEALGAASPAFEADFLANLVLVLEISFLHRTRGLEKKDGNPANEVRVLADSILTNGGRMGSDKTVKFDPAKTVLGLKEGDPITLDPPAFRRLSDAYFAEIEKKFS
jgi:hypothetical protein